MREWRSVEILLIDQSFPAQSSPLKEPFLYKFQIHLFKTEIKGSNKSWGPLKVAEAAAGTEQTVADGAGASRMTDGPWISATGDTRHLSKLHDN